MVTASVLVEAILRLDRPGPKLVAIDGRSAVGKSTLAAAVADTLDALVIDGDDFYAGGTAEEWDAMSPAGKAAHCIDWRRQRPILEQLAKGEQATWHAYDWEANDGRLSESRSVALPRPVVILEGVYSARPELADLFHLRVLAEAPAAVRHERWVAREGEGYPDDWSRRWTEAEDWYFTRVMPPEAFDLMLAVT